MVGIKVAILGFGTVGEGVYKTIQSHQEELHDVLGKKVKVVAVLIKNQQKARNISGDILVTANFDEILDLPELDIVFEAIVQQEPSFTYLKKSIKKGCSIITANKEMFAHHGKELMELANQHNVTIGFEATVAGGIPIIQTLQQLLKVNRVHRIEGILNGTSNFILTEMREKNQSFVAALKLAQEKGYAEADPTNDVEGNDAFFKLMILSRLALGDEPDWKNVDLEGITSITCDLIEQAEKLNLRFKHIARVERLNDRIKGSVRPVLVGKSHPFYNIEGVGNAVNVHSDIVGSITLQGPGAGMFPTASAMIEDLVYVSQHDKNNRKARARSNPTIVPSGRESREYWLITGQSEIVNTPLLTKIDQLSEGIYLIKAEKKVVEKLANQQKILHFFQILDDINFGNQEKQEQIKVVL